MVGDGLAIGRTTPAANARAVDLAVPLGGPDQDLALGLGQFRDVRSRVQTRSVCLKCVELPIARTSEVPSIGRSSDLVRA